MLRGTVLLLFMLICGINRVNAQYFEKIENESERILVSLSEGDSLTPAGLSKLHDLLAAKKEINPSQSKFNTNQHSIDSLTSHLDEFESELKNISTDSAFALFNYWYLHLQNLFYDYSKEKFFSTSVKKILFFSTSMSCPCTLKMCREQSAGLLNFISAADDKYDCWIVDSYWYNDLQIKYETLFAPSVIVFDGSNMLLYKIEYDENMIALLSNYLKNLNN